MKPQNYVVFQSPSQQVPYTFLYPADWQLRETVDKERVKIFIAGPRNQEDTYTVAFTVRIRSASAQKPEGVLFDFLDRFQQMPGFQEIGRSSGMVAGQPALEVELSYSMPLPLNSANPQMKTIRERYILFEFDDSLIELIYAAPDDTYDAWLPDFRTLVQTFVLPENHGDEAYHSLVGVAEAVPTASLRESAAGYEVGGGKDGK